MGGSTSVKQSVDLPLPGVGNEPPVLSSVRPATLSLHWVRALQCNLRQIPQRSLLCKFISVSNSSPTLEAPFSLCLQNNPYMKKDGSIGIGPTISESKVIGTCNFPEEMKYLK